MYVQLSSPLSRTTMRTPAALSAARRRPLPSIWLPAARVSVAPVSERVAVWASPLSAACTLCPLEARSRVTSATASARDCAGARAGGAAGVAEAGGTDGAEAAAACCVPADAAGEAAEGACGACQPVEVLSGRAPPCAVCPGWVEKLPTSAER